MDNKSQVQKPHEGKGRRSDDPFFGRNLGQCFGRWHRNRGLHGQKYNKVKKTEKAAHQLVCSPEHKKSHLLLPAPFRNEDLFELTYKIAAAAYR